MMNDEDMSHRPPIRQADGADSDAIGRLLHEFNTEYDVETPGPVALARRVRHLLELGSTQILLAGAPPSGVVVLRFRPQLWSEHLSCYVEELYVTPETRRLGLGRALMVAAIDHARSSGADRMELGTGEGDIAARALYESLGFASGGVSGGPNYFYERDLSSD